MGNSDSKRFRGLALIVGHENYMVTRLEKRSSCSFDVDHLEKCLNVRGFKVDVLPDLDFSDVAKAINYNAKLVDHSNIDCLLVIVLTHGEKGGKLNAKDGRLYYTHDVWKPFIEVQTLKGKPKLFLFQACRDAFAAPDPLNPQLISSNKRPSSILPRLPHTKDCLIAYSTFKDSSKTGTDYIQALCDQLDLTEDPVDILTLLTKVTRLAVDKAGNSPNFQAPNFVSFLHQPLLLPCRLYAPSSENSSASDPTSQAVQPVDTTSQAVQQTSTVTRQEKYNWSGSGRCLILHSQQDQTEADNFQQVLTKLNFISKKFVLDKQFPVELQKESSSLLDCGCLLVVVLAPLSERKFGGSDALQWVFSVCNETYPLSSVWKHFAPCQQLIGKPKLFFFLNTSDASRDNELCAAEDTEVLQAAEHTDFLLALGFTKSQYDTLMKSVSSGDEILTVLTTAMQQTPEQATNLPHFHSSLRFPLNLKDSPPDPDSPAVLVAGQAPKTEQEGLTEDEPIAKKSRNDETGKIEISISVSGPNVAANVTLQAQGSQQIETNQQQETVPESPTKQAHLVPLIRMQELKVGINYKIEKLEWDDKAKFGPALTGHIRVDDILRFVFFPKRVTKKEYPKRSLGKYCKKPSKFSLVIRRFINTHDTVTPDFEIVEDKDLK